MVTSALNRALVALPVLAVGFVIYSLVVALGEVRGLDQDTFRTFQHLWVPGLLPLFQAIALLGGIEATTLLTAGLAVYLWRTGFRAEAWTMLVLPVAVGVEVVYRRLLYQPGPPGDRPDGPSLTQFVGVAQGSSYPSGHVMRAVIVYGLAAFVVHRLAPPGPLRRLVLPAAAVMIAAVAIDRLYLSVHWQSDVIGGLLLGGLALAAAVVWLDRPRVPR